MKDNTLDFDGAAKSTGSKGSTRLSGNHSGLTMKEHFAKGALLKAVGEPVTKDKFKEPPITAKGLKPVEKR